MGEAGPPSVRAARRRIGRLLGSRCALALLATPGTALAAVSGTVTQLSDGSPIEGAAVTLAGSAQPPVTGSTAPDGTFSIDVGGGGPFGVGVQAPGFASQSQSGVQQGAQAPFALAPATFTPLPVDVASTGSVAADARTGVFFALGDGAPEVYRTVDYGGSWTPATLSHDDPEDGLRNSNQRNVLEVSAVSGEVAVAADVAPPAVSFSRDYGLTWRTVGGDFAASGWAPTRDPLLFWGHASPAAPEDVLLFAQQAPDGSWSVWRADMSAAAPEFVRDPSDPFGTGAEIAGADSANGSFLGRVGPSGALSFAPLTASGPITFGADEATGLPTPPRLLRLGGAKEDSAPPDGALVVGGDDPFVAQMLTKSAGATSFAGSSSSAPTTLSNCTFGTDGFGGSVAPTATGTTGAGSATGCWLQKNGTDPLSIGLAEGHDLAHDAAFGLGNFVVLNGGHGQGPEKSSRLGADGVPVTEFDKAAGGTGPDSGGFSVRGMISASVNDTEYGPGGAGEVAVASQIALASKDGGRTMTELILPRAAGGLGPAAVQWWRGASGDWLVFGHHPNRPQDCGDKLSGFLNWNGTSTLAAPNVGGSTCADLGGQSSVFSLQGVAGTDTVFIGLGTFEGGNERLYRARLVPGDPPALADVFDLSAPLTNKPAAIAYCPAASAREDMRDVLFVAAGEPYPHALLRPGSLVRIAGATTGSPVPTVVDSVPHVPDAPLADVRADCATGVVYSGGKSNDATDATGFYKSVDGGRTFERIRVPGPNTPSIGELTAVGLNPGDPDDVTVAAVPAGTAAHSADGGASWTIVNDPATARPMRVQDIEFPPVPAGGAPRAQAARSSAGAAGSRAPVTLVGTDGGAFRGDLSATTGLIAVTAGADGSAGIGARITTLGSDSHPVVIPAPGTAVPTMIFHRENGLYETSAEQGSWPLASAIPATTGNDDLPAAVTDPAGRVRLAFARRGTRAGVYVATRGLDGAWAAPRRVSGKAGDTLPAIALAGSRIHVAFLRTRGARRGVYYASTRGRGWRAASRVRGTSAADARTALGGPSLATRAGRPQLVFARSGRRAGVYYGARRGPGWRAPKRLTRRAGDSEPVLAVASNGVRQVVFRRARGKRARARGLFALRGRRAWSLRRIRKTVAADREPALALNGRRLLLTFARPSGAAPGVYLDLASAGGRWLPRPRLLSAGETDRSPALLLGGAGRLTIVFDRG